MTDIRQAARRAEPSDGLDVAVRVGLVAYGLVHLLIGWLALQVAFGDQSKSASATGAFHTLAQQPLGAVLLWGLGLGLLALVVWKAVEAWRSWHREDGVDRLTSLASAGGKAVVYAVLGGLALTTAMGQSGGGGGTDTLTSRLMKMPAGPVIVGILGLGIIGHGGYLLWRGWSERFLRDLDGGPRRPQVSKAYRILGKAGFMAKGAAIAVVGALFAYAALTHDPQKSAGLDQALQQVAAQPFGQALLVAVAVGIGCYGLFSFVQARHVSP